MRKAILAAGILVAVVVFSHRLASAQSPKAVGKLTESSANVPAEASVKSFFLSPALVAIPQDLFGTGLEAGFKSGTLTINIPLPDVRAKSDTKIVLKARQDSFSLMFVTSL